MRDEMMPAFAEVHVVSDLHLGGHAGFQIFNQGARLAATIRQLAQRPASPLALVLNGDVFDFLAEEPVSPTGLDLAEAVPKVERIVTADAQFAPVFEALRDFLAGDGHHLVVVLGNHDVELALPNVRYWLTNWLTAKTPAARARIVWAVDGAGFSCRIGSKRVLCVHGNEMDAWNVVDHRALLNLVRAYNRAQPLPEWQPNAGTRLVIEVMNQIKRAHPIVDLLKPETQAALPVVVALDPKYLGAVGRVLKLSARKTADGIRMTAGFLGAEDPEEDERPSEREALEATLGDLVAAPQDAAQSAFEQRALRLQAIIAGDRPIPTAITSDGDQLLGMGSWFREKAAPETLRRALSRWLKDDRTFDVSAPDEQFKALDAAVGGDIDYLVAGHTHLRRALLRSKGGTYYFNTGTWIRLVRLPSSVLADAAEFTKVYASLGASQMSALDDAKVGNANLVQVFPTVASICTTDGGRVVGALFDADVEGKLNEVAGTRFPS